MSILTDISRFGTLILTAAIIAMSAGCQKPEVPDTDTDTDPEEQTTPENPGGTTDPDNPGGSTDPDNPGGTTDPDEPPLTGPSYTITLPDGVSATKRGKPFTSGEPAIQGETLTLSADALSSGWEVSSWAVWQRSELHKKFDNSSASKWNYTVSGDDAYNDEIKIGFIERSGTAPVTVYTHGEDSIPGLPFDGLPSNPTADEFANYWYDDVCDPSKYYDYLLLEVPFAPNAEKYVDIVSLFGNAPDLRLYYLGPYNNYMNPGKQVHLISEEQVTTDVFTFALKRDPSDGKTKLYLKDNLDNSDKSMMDPVICAIQGNRWYIVGLKLVTQFEVESAGRQKEVDDFVTELLASPEFAALETEFDKVKKVHDYLAGTITYGREDGHSYYAQMAYGALIRKMCVCEGYSRAFKTIIDRMGMSSTVIIGNNGFHAWNTVKVDGKWYQIDVTWDDYDGAAGIAYHYKYFLKSDDFMRENGHSFVTLYPCPDNYPLPNYPPVTQNL